MTDLHQQVAHFKHWAESLSGHYGEWECEYDRWGELWGSAITAIDTHRSGEVPDQVVEDLIYAIARDNECERIRQYVMGAPELLATLAKAVVPTQEPDAKWQIAISVAEIASTNTAELLRPFLSDNDEYVRRRSLMAIAPFAPQEAEAIALRNLGDQFEYTRIAAIHVLSMVKSPHLTICLDRLVSDPNEYVRHNVRELRAAQ